MSEPRSAAALTRYVIRLRVLAALVSATTLACVATTVSAAEPRHETLSAWDAYVKATEARIEGAIERPRAQPPSSVGGEAVAVAGGTIHHWSGGIVVRGVTLDTMIARLLNPGTPPPQQAVVRSRVLGRSGDNSLRVYLRLARQSIVTVTYDTEHDVTLTRRSPALATSRSISTRIAEIGGDDRGFLWRLNSYWRYEQVGDGVLVEVETLTLSRDVPAILRPIVMPIVGRVARESVKRTLDALSGWFAPGPPRPPELPGAPVPGRSL